MWSLRNPFSSIRKTSITASGRAPRQSATASIREARTALSSAPRRNTHTRRKRDPETVLENSMPGRWNTGAGVENLEAFHPRFRPSLHLVPPIAPRKRMVGLGQIAAGDPVAREQLSPAPGPRDNILEVLRGEIISAQNEQDPAAEPA